MLNGAIKPPDSQGLSNIYPYRGRSDYGLITLGKSIFTRIICVAK